MDNLTKLVRDEITRQYRSVRQFAFAVGVPLSTITSARDEKTTGMAIIPICSGVSNRRMTILTPICSNMEPTFSAILHATPLATLSRNSPPTTLRI